MPPKPPTSEFSVVSTLIEEISRARTESAVQAREVLSKIDAYQGENRQEIKELRADVTDILVRLAEGSEKIKNLRKDVEESKLGCPAATKPATALVANRYRNTEDSDEAIRIRKKNRSNLAWWQLTAFSAALAYLVPTLVQKTIDVLAKKGGP